MCSGGPGGCSGLNGEVEVGKVTEPLGGEPFKLGEAPPIGAGAGLVGLGGDSANKISVGEWDMWEVLADVVDFVGIFSLERVVGWGRSAKNIGPGVGDDLEDINGMG